jgi:hypothetical protein
MRRYRDCDIEGCKVCHLCGIQLIYIQHCPCRECFVYASCSEICNKRKYFYDEQKPKQLT